MAPARAEEILLSEDDYARLITQAYADRFGEHPKTLFVTDAQPAEPPDIEPRVLIAAAKQRLIESMPVDETSLRRLAQERASRIKGHLTEKGKIPDKRVFIVQIEVGRASDGDAIRTNLTLSGI
ncbi:MAG: hypothetical protein ACNYWU_08615 [Desulfobacterales bacterium]